MSKQALIVDDEKEVRLVWVALAQDCGLEVTEASDGREATELLKSDAAFDLIILDQIMPFVSGAEVLKFIRETERLKNIPVILSTASRATQSLGDIPADQLTSYVNKAAGIEKLRRAITQVLGTEDNDPE
ncbi:MAG TPA: response regulator [Blastocatellia bacterium]|nr:response regulator [Blastocatellia bacterium]